MTSDNVWLYAFQRNICLSNQFPKRENVDNCRVRVCLSSNRGPFFISPTATRNTGTPAQVYGDGVEECITLPTLLLPGYERTVGPGHPREWCDLRSLVLPVAENADNQDTGNYQSDRTSLPIMVMIHITGSSQDNGFHPKTQVHAVKKSQTSLSQAATIVESVNLCSQKHIFWRVLLLLFSKNHEE